MVIAGGLVKAQNVASMDYASVLQSMPESKKMTADLDNWYKTKSDDLQKQFTALRAEYDKYEASKSSLSAQQQQAKEADFQKRMQSLQQMGEQANQELLKKRESMAAPIIKKLNDAVAKVAKANNFSFIIDNEALIYIGGADATPLVKKELGL